MLVLYSLWTEVDPHRRPRLHRRGTHRIGDPLNESDHALIVFYDYPTLPRSAMVPVLSAPYLGRFLRGRIGSTVIAVGRRET